MYKLCTLVTLLAFSHYSVAQVKYIEKDTPAPYTGYLFTPEKEKETRFKLIDLDYYKKLSEVNTERLKVSYEQQEVLEKQVTVWRDSSTKLASELASRQSRDFWENLMYFGLGALITVGLTYSVNQASK